MNAKPRDRQLRRLREAALRLTALLFDDEDGPLWRAALAREAETVHSVADTLVKGDNHETR